MDTSKKRSSWLFRLGIFAWLALTLALAAFGFHEHTLRKQESICRNNIQGYAAALSLYYRDAEAKRVSGQEVPPLLPTPAPAEFDAAFQ